MLQDEALLLAEHVLLQEGKSCVLHWQTQKRWMLLQARFLSHAGNSGKLGAREVGFQFSKTALLETQMMPPGRYAGAMSANSF